MLEARVGIEPTHKGFADLSLTAWVPRLWVDSKTSGCCCLESACSFRLRARAKPTVCTNAAPSVVMNLVLKELSMSSPRVRPQPSPVEVTSLPRAQKPDACTFCPNCSAELH